MLHTDDLFLGGFALTRGGELAGVEVRGVNGRRVAFFQIEGPDMEDVQRDYYRGAARVDLRLLKSEVRRLKDIAFGAMRQECPQPELPYRPSAIHSREVGRTTTRSAEDADVGAEGAARGNEEKRDGAHSRRRDPETQA